MSTFAADFGGRRIKLGLVDKGQVLARSIVPAEADQPLVQRLPIVACELESLAASVGVPLAQVRGIGFAYPSVIDPRSGRIMDHFGKFGDVAALDLKGWAQQRLQLALVIENDARMALIGEWRFGAGRASENVAMITLGAGLGVSAVVEGRVMRGVHGQAGILGGHVTVEIGGHRCVCGNVGCAEAEASTSVLQRMAEETKGWEGSALRRERELNFEAVFRWAREHDPCAEALKERSLQVWSALAVSVIHMFDPEILVLGGGVMGSGEVILPAVRNYVRRHAHTPWGEVQVVGAELGENAPLLACEWLVDQGVRSR